MHFWSQVVQKVGFSILCYSPWGGLGLVAPGALPGSPKTNLSDDSYALTALSSTSPSTTSDFATPHQADGITFGLIQNGFDERYDISSGAPGLRWQGCGSPACGEKEHQRSAPTDGSDAGPSQGA
jgi:hypothetical protein